jgi:hypothetical protein
MAVEAFPGASISVWEGFLMGVCGYKKQGYLKTLCVMAKKVIKKVINF